MTTMQDLEAAGPEPGEPGEPAVPEAIAPDADTLQWSATVPLAAADLPDVKSPRRRRTSRRAVLAAFVIGVLMVAVAAVGTVFAYEQTYVGRVAAGVSVGGVSIAGMTRDEADAALRTAFTSLGTGTVVVRTSAGTIQLTYAELGRQPDADAMVDAALSVGRSGTAVERVIEEARTAIGRRDLPLRVLVDPTVLKARIAALAATQNADAVSATVIDGPGGFATTPAANGRQVDEAAMVSALTAALSSTSTPDRLDLPLAERPVSPSVSDAAAAAASAQANQMVGDVVLADGKDHWTIPAATVKPWISFGQVVGGAYGPVVDLPSIEKALGGLVSKVTRKPISATFYLGGSGQVVGVKASVDGRALDVPGTAQAIQAALVARAAGGTRPATSVTPVLTVTAPDLTTAQATKAAPLMKAISTWTTYYVPGPHNGNGANISLPAKAINGTIVAPGATFSFWKAVGVVSLAKGYKLGGAIINGHSVEGASIGGGICSTSTTLFNAALRAGLQMGIRKNHYYYISRYPKGLDATVFIEGSSVQDMTWKNDTKFPILIRAYTSYGVVKFTLFSVPTGRKVSFSKPAVSNYRPGTTITQYTTSLRPGAKLQTEYAADGQDVVVVRTVRDASGKVIHTDTYVSHYARMVGIIMIGK